MPPRRSRIAVQLALTAAFTACAAPAAAAPAGVVTGTVGAVPRGARAEVRAIDLSTGAVVGARTPGRSGAFTLRLPAGGYLLASGLIPRQGRGTPKSAVLPVSLGAGQRRSKLPLRPRRATRRPSRGRTAWTQQDGSVSVGQLAVGVPAFTGATGDWAAMNKGLAEMLITDLVATDKCSLTVIELERRAEVIAEQQRSRSEFFDPATAVRPGKLIAGDAYVVGKLSSQGSELGYDIAIVETRTGRVMDRVKGTLPGGAFFDGVDALSRELAGRLCKVHESYKVRLQLQTNAAFGTYTTAGSIDSELTATRVAKDRWEGAAALAWNAVSFSPLGACDVVDRQLPTTTWRARIQTLGPGQAGVGWSTDGPMAVTGTLACKDGGSIPNMPGPGTDFMFIKPSQAPIPETARLPLSGSTGSAAQGFGSTTTGTLTITPGPLVRDR